MNRYKRYTRRKNLFKQAAVVVLLFVLGFMFVQTASYVVTQGEIPVISGFNLFTKEADTTLGWNLILVNDDYCVPSDYEVELTELSNGKKWIHEFIRSFSKCSIMPERLAPNYS